jgi:hypothetical protein
MKEAPRLEPRSLSAPEYVLALHEPRDNTAVLLRNRMRGQTLQRIASAETIASPDFQRWLGEQNRAGSDVYVTWNRTGWFVLPFAASWFDLTRPHRTH